MQEKILAIVKSINELLWGPPMMVALVGFGLVSTIYLGFAQLKRIKLGWNESFGKIFHKKDSKEGSLSSFQALATSIAAQVGTGNIGGVAAAISSGGPGAMFWMWVTALVGMSTIFVEATLAQKYRKKDKNGQLVGGPAYYISQGFDNKGMKTFGKGLAKIYAVLIVLALGFIGNMVQSNSIATSVNTAFGIPTIAVGVIIAIVSALIFIGGMQRIGKFAELVVPFMALFYIIGSLVAMFIFRSHIIPTISLIFKEAFTFHAVAGGAVGYSIKSAIRYGVARGLFSNEAGLGSTPNSHAVADVSHPVVQGSVAMVGVFIDTIIICSATGLVVIATGAYQSGAQGVMITMNAFSEMFGNYGSKFVASALVFFSLTTVIGWYYFAENNIKYLFKSDNVDKVFKVMVVVFILSGSVLKVPLVWELADMFNAVMAIPNIIGLVVLLNEVKQMNEDYEKQLNLGKIPQYHYVYEQKYKRANGVNEKVFGKMI